MKLFGKTLVLFGALAALLTAAASAEAAQRLRKNETWCLETSVGGGRYGGGTINMCNYETRAQCIASKVAQGDRCELNPVIAFEEWNRRHGR
jgi:hypothetical protein